MNASTVFAGNLRFGLWGLRRAKKEFRIAVAAFNGAFDELDCAPACTFDPLRNVSHGRFGKPFPDDAAFADPFFTDFELRFDERN